MDADASEAARWYEAAAEQGRPEAVLALARLYSAGGAGLEPQAERALEWMHRAAELGDETAQLELANRYVEGDGVVRDAARAAKYYRPLAEAGMMEAQFALGRLLAQGRAPRPR